MYDFELVKPKTLAEALEALKGDEAQPLSGGQTLIPTMKQRLAAPETLVSLLGIDELKGVKKDGDTLVIGGATNHATVCKEAAGVFHGLSYLAGKIGDPAVRNRGTIGGSIANNDPAACYPSAAMACGATIVTNDREIPADEFFQGLFTTALEEGEIVTGVRFPIPEVSDYQKFEQPASRFPLTGVFLAKFGDRVGVGVTGASEDGVFRWTEAEEALAADFRPEAIADLTVSPDGMIGDLHGTPEYRAHLVKVLTGRAVKAAK
ncbi:carbon monoxide dehydrogenase [Oceanicola sp. 22II-s10i]|uniref:FAD binding domain-containing protein n=1 Tax=Oceanicola sp. 22II-s10i TaxID=1317116 RepID=UPI000B522AF7|nr:xanthine dehydrogenase family protein subunit M [Oceanicola sp. 22II-s10i]OWU86054.1 carbon monoxide dehydrogenase [Oceanicola sp. 22II-s10i]